MENINDYIWTDENLDENEGVATTILDDDNNMVEVCMACFCGSTAGNFYGCWQDRPMRTSSCI